MIKTVFEWREDQEYGGYGWIPKGFPDFNISNGLGVAHDTLEHFPATGHGMLTDEMLAFGAMLFIRAESGWFFQHSIFGADKSMGSDIGEFLAQNRWNPDHQKLTNPGRTMRLDDCMEDELAAILNEGVRSANANHDDEPTRFAHGWQTDYMRGWMRRGYRQAQRRYKGNKPEEVAYLFDQIKGDVDKRFKNGDEGEELRVRVNPKSLEFRIERADTYEEMYQ